MYPATVLLFDSASRIQWISQVHARFDESPEDLSGLSIFERVQNVDEVDKTFSECLLRQRVAEGNVVVRAGEPPVTQEWAARFIPLGQPAQVSVVALAREIPEALKLLTRREVEVLGLIATDLATKEVAARLGVAASTVETHVQHLKQKLRCRGVAGLVRFALAAGLG